jgi:hypothetical protein
LEIHVQADTTLVSHAPDFPIDCDIFLRVKLTLRQTRPIEVLEYELSRVLYGNSVPAEYVDDIRDWGLVTARKAIGIGTTFHYTVSKLTKLTERAERTGVPVEGWLHFRVNGVHENEVGATVYRLNVLTSSGAVSTDILGKRNLAAVSGAEFQKLPFSARSLGSVAY